MYPQRHTLFLVFFDSLCTGIIWLMQKLYGHGIWEAWTIVILLGLALAVVGVLYALDTYHLGRDRSFAYLAILVALGTFGLHLVLPFIFRLFNLTFSLGGVSASFFLVLTYLLLIRRLFYWWSVHWKVTQNLLVLADFPEEIQWSSDFFQQIGEVQLVGFLSESPIPEIEPLPRLGNWQALEEIISREKIEALCVSSRRELPETLKEKLLQFKLQGLTVLGFPHYCQRLKGFIPLEYLDAQNFILSEGFRFQQSEALRKIKRVMDLSFAVLGLLALFPAMGIVSWLNRRYNPGPLFYRQKRVGLDEKEFWAYKFRSMHPQAEQDGIRWATPEDPRATRWGHWMRQTHLDELPQVWNILKGEMSFVGPRPERREWIEQIQQEIPYYSLRHFAQPGLTGWAQLNLTYADSIQSSKLKLQYDLFYLRHASLIFDLLILAKTLRLVFFRRGR